MISSASLRLCVKINSVDINRWRQIDELLDAVLEIPNERREAFLSEKCSGDDELKREVLSLLKAQKETDAFLENSAMNLMAKEIAHDGTTVVDFSILGRELGNYRIERPLGAGGMGEVFLAHDSKLNRKVALKILPAEFVLDSERVKRFEREAKAVSALNHPNIVTIYDFGQLNGINFIVTEHIEGKTVRELINAKVSLKETLNVVSQTCEALHAAHKSGIIHRDIKPENIMVRPDGYAKVLDFGLAKLNPQADSIHVSLANYTQKGMIIGTLAYMSPEQISDDTVDQRADLWSLGVVLYEMATGKKPFQAESKQATFNAILSGEPLAATDSNASLPVELDRILEKALEKDKDLRYQTASDFRADLKRVRREIDSSPSSSSWSKSMRRTNPQTIQTTEKSRLIYAVPLAALILITAGVACYFYWQKYATQPAPNWTQARNEHLTDEPGTEFMPSLAPDGEAFIYVAKNGEKYDIFRRRVGGKNATNLTPDTANEDETHPAYSPDGKRIAFRSTRYPAGIYLMESTGENPRRLCKDGYHPAWSPDGKEIVSSEEDQNLPGTRYKSRLIITNVATGEQRVLHDGYAAQPQWSPHGQRVAFWIMQPGGKRDVATISATGGEPVLVTDLSGVNWNPVWSPDGNYLYFASDRKGNMGFWRMRIDETSGKVLGEPESVPTPAKFVRHLSFSRDGKRLIYVQTEDESNLKAVKFDQAAEKIVGEPFSITRREQEVVRPEISPDGKQFVMRLTRLTQHDIAAVGGGGWRDFTNDEFSENYPRWSPDGNRIAYVSDRSGNYEIWTMDADGTNHQQWTFGNQTSASYPFWSPDGQKLGYDFNHKAYILDLTKPPGEQKPELLPGAENYSLVIAWDWSPDGKKLSGIFTEKGKQFAKDDNGLRVGYYSFDTGRWEDLNIATYNLRWLADSSRLIYYDEGNKAYIVDIHTKKSRVVFAPPNEEQLKSVGINRPEDLIYYTNFSSESDVWMLDLSENQ